MTKVESKIVVIKRTDEQIYSLLSSFKNLSPMAEAAKLEEWEAEDEWCKFNVKGMGRMELKMIEREPFKTIKIAGGEGIPFELLLWIQLKQVAPYDTRLKITLSAEMGAMMSLMLRSKLQEGVDLIAESLAKALNI
jgi:carbon monoxide dehydrogenase subunit G